MLCAPGNPGSVPGRHAEQTGVRGQRTGVDGPARGARRRSDGARPVKAAPDREKQRGIPETTTGTIAAATARHCILMKTGQKRKIRPEQKQSRQPGRETQMVPRPEAESP